MLTIDEIRVIIPHRYPFLLIDRVTEYEPGVRAKAIKCVSVNEPYFTGHFPDKCLMPGVLILEALAQTGGIALMTDSASSGKLAVLGGVKNARFLKPVTPGDVLELECHILRRLGAIGTAAGEAKVNGETVCKAELTFALTQA
ncbi:MAG: 3-hydroxyacyl-ACP dehydratase FabZ [Oscillospiraceae bacterium]|jgi:3-hydroxyacyl-[acyl-carrier-protein] dehydratase|nr:3-hydroxyacyl-ACP dehydratase FabZ [Oscillospiraceae bacterium]